MHPRLPVALNLCFLSFFAISYRCHCSSVVLPLLVYVVCVYLLCFEYSRTVKVFLAFFMPFLPLGFLLFRLFIQLPCPCVWCLRY